MDLGDVEGLVIATYERAGLDPCRPAKPARLVRAVLGEDAIVRIDLKGAPAALFLQEGRPRIAVRSHVPAPYAAFYLLHELGHHQLRAAGYRGDEEERLADLFAACALAPRPAMAALYRAVGWDLEAMAAACTSTETWAALRIGEVLRIPLAAVSPRSVRVRGPEDWCWPAEDVIRRWARRAGPGMRRVAIGDGKGRSVVVAEEAA